MFILASKSPRRTELLQTAKCNFRTEPSDAEEFTGDADPQEIAVANARLKAAAAIVALDGHIHYKPKDAADARRMLRTLAGRTHEVITGIAFVKDGECFTHAEVTRVTFDDMTDEEIAAYVATGEPMDKSGSYALQGGAGIYIKKIDGSYSNVVGLPLNAVKKLAKQTGVNLRE